MDSDADTEMRRIASNNPAMSIPASSKLYPEEFRPQASRKRSSRQKSSSTPSTEVADSTSTLTEDPTPATRLSKHDQGWRRVIRNFSPSWFSTTMGTGVVSLIFIAIPFPSPVLYWFSVAFFLLNTVLFSACMAASVLRYSIYPEIWGVMIADPNNSLFLGTVPMGFATLIEAWCMLCVPHWGRWAVYVAWGAWMLDAIVAVSVTVSLPFLLMRRESVEGMERITAAQLLPIAATIVASGTGAEVASHLVTLNAQYSLGTLLTSYTLWGLSTPLALTILVIYYQRLALHKLPPREIIVSMFLPLGPLGMGGYTILCLGRVSRSLFPLVDFFSSPASSITPVPSGDVVLPQLAGDIFFLLGTFISLMMWAFGLAWLVFALASIYATRPFPFNMGWWGFTFPLGVFSISTMTFGEVFPSLFFRVLGTIFGACVILLWCVVAAGTAKGAYTGNLFHAPCLKNLKRQPEDEKDQVVEAERGQR